jgi:hypothetical protein
VRSNKERIFFTVSGLGSVGWLLSCGGSDFPEMETKAKLGAKAMGRRELENNQGYKLKEPQRPPNRFFDPEKCSLRLKNDHIWQVY